MARTYNNLFPQIYDFEALCQAYLKARRCKRYRGEILRFWQRLEENLIQLHNELLWKTYRTGDYRTFYIHEPKARLVAALPFRDRVVHHALVSVIEPIWESRFIYDSYACRVGKGTHAGAERTQAFLRRAQRRWGRVYCLKGDIAKYFPSIDHATLKVLLRKRIACQDTLWLCDEIIDSAKLLNNDQPKGIPIGNLTSQLFANIYLHELDKFVKYALRERFYVRYMDDFIILGADKAYLHYLRKQIAGFLAEHLLLQLNGKTQMFPVRSRGVDFLGYCIWPTHRLLRVPSKNRMRRKLHKIQRLYAQNRITLKAVNNIIQSWLGHVKHCDCYRLRHRLLTDFILTKQIVSKKGGVPGKRREIPDN